jgi:formylglycine-generating enzyme required for sulfatase activity
VWEWTQSFYADYPYRAEEGRKDVDAEGWPVLRGGSWDNLARDARCACRGGLVPDGFDVSVGFRVVVSLANSGF